MAKTPFDRAQEVDSLVIGVVEQAVAAPAVGLNGRGGWAILALGGYGRGRLAPFSDIDLAVLHAGLPQDLLGRLVQAVLYPLWDAGIRLSHTVRTVKESAAFGREDIQWLTSSLDARLLVGDTALFHEFSARMLDVAKRRSAGAFIGSLIDMANERRREYGDSGRLLEPDLKEGRGGLRDIQTVRWLEKALPPGVNLLSESDRQELSEAEEFFWEARSLLHELAGRDQNRVKVELQPALAEHFFASKERAPALFGRLLYKHLRSAALITDNFFDAVRPGRRAGRLTDGALLGLPMTPRTLLEMLNLGLEGLPLLERVSHTGALETLVPEWAAVKGLSFSDTNHRHPVDTHSFLTVSELVGFRSGAGRGFDRFLAARLSEEILHPDWLLLAGLFHDIGKGRDAPHSEAGADLIPEISRRLGLDRHASETFGFLVRHHLLLSHVATRRDLNDPRVIAGVAAVIGDGDRLRMLYLLTLADAMATGPRAWNSWKSALVDELFFMTLEALEGQPGPGRSSQVRLSEKHFALLERDDEIVIAHWPEAEGPDELAVVAPDRPGLISRIAGVLALNRITVLAAGFYTTDDGRALEVFKVAAAFEPDITAEMYEALGRGIAKSLSGQMALSYHLDALARRYQHTRGNGAPPRVVFDNKASDQYTVIEVHAPDMLGVLYEATGALAELNLDIHFAKVSTFGDRAVDVFYVSNPGGGKITEPDHLKEIEKNVLFRLSKI